MSYLSTRLFLLRPKLNWIIIYIIGFFHLHLTFGLVFNPGYPGYPNTRVFPPHFRPGYPEANTWVVRVVDFWPNLPVFCPFSTKNSAILFNNPYIIFFQRVISKFRIKIFKKLCHFQVKSLHHQFFNHCFKKNIHNLKQLQGY